MVNEAAGQMEVEAAVRGRVVPLEAAVEVGMMARQGAIRQASRCPRPLATMLYRRRAWHEPWGSLHGSF